MATRQLPHGPALEGSQLCWAILDALGSLSRQQPSRAAAVTHHLQRWGYEVTEEEVARLSEELRVKLGRDIPGVLAHTRFRQYYPAVRNAESLPAVESQFEGKHRDAARRLWFLLQEIPGKPSESTYRKPNPHPRMLTVAKKKAVREPAPTPDQEPQAVARPARSSARASDETPAVTGAARTSRRSVDAEKAAALFALQLGGIDAAMDALARLKRKLGVE